MLKKLNAILEKLLPFIAPTSVLLGIFLSPWLRSYTFLITWIFAFMTFSGSLGTNFKDLKKVIMQPLPIFICLFTLHLLVPAISWALGNTFFGNDIYTITGLVLAYIIPTGVSSFMWVSIYGGNVALALSIILISTFLSPLVVPMGLNLLFGAKVSINILGMMKGLFWMLVFPSLLGMLLNQITSGKIKESWGTPLAPFSKLGLGMVIALNSSVVAPYLIDINAKLVAIALTSIFIASLGYLFGWFIAGFLNWDRSVIVTMLFNSGMRNITAGAVLATSYFPSPVAVPVVTGMLFQQVLASFYGRIIYRYYRMDKKISNT